MIKRPTRILLLLFFFIAILGHSFITHAQQVEETEDKLVFGVYDDRPPYTIRGPLGSLSGFDVDVGHALSKHMGRQAEIRYVPVRKISEALENREIDVAIGVVPNKSLEDDLLFTTPITTGRLRLFVHEDLSFIHTLKDLKGLRIGINRKMDIQELLRLVPGVRFTPISDTRAALDDLEQRRLHVYLGDEFECRYYIRVDEHDQIRMVGGSLLLARRSIAVSKKRPELYDHIADAVLEMQSGLVLDRLHRDWIGRALAPGELQRRSLIMALVVLVVIASALLAVIIWNQRLESAVSLRTQQLTAEHEHFQNIFDHASDGIVVIDPSDTRVKEANQAFLDILGFSKSEMLSQKLDDFDISEEKHFLNQIRTVYQSGESIMFESRLKNRIGQNVDLLIHARPLPFKDKRMIEAIARDMTERKKIEALKDTILQDVSHELKTPLSKMAMSIDLLERNLNKESKEVYGKFFDICHKSISRLENTITGILNISKLEAESFHMSTEKFSIQDVLLNVIDELNIFAQKKGVQLEHHFAKEPLLLFGDIEMIHRLFVNIIHNAIKFTDEGAVVVKALIEDNFIKVLVKDNGVGLQTQDLHRIFGRFFQKTPSYEGCGIGLTIAQKIVDLHEGRLWAESEGLGQGTTLMVRLPLEDLPKNTNAT